MSDQKTDEKKKTIFVQQICPPVVGHADGIATYCTALAQLFDSDGRVSVAPMWDAPVRPSRLLNNLYHWRSFYHTLKQADADVVHINGYASFTVLQSFLATWWLGKKIVYTAHWHPYKMLRRPLLGKMFFNVFVRPFLGKVKAVVTLNEDDTAYFRGLRCPVTRIPHWCRFQVESHQQPLSGGNLAQVEKNKKMILFVGRFNADNKGFDYLYHLPEGVYDIHCVGMGDVEVRSDMTIHTNIPTEKLQELYAKASLVVIPSKYEAFSYVALEALTSGTPVVMSDRVRIADYLNDCRGVSIFRYGDHEGFVSAVASMIGSAVDTEKVLSIFSPDAIREKYARLYLSVCGRS